MIMSSVLPSQTFVKHKELQQRSLPSAIQTALPVKYLILLLQQPHFQVGIKSRRFTLPTDCLSPVTETEIHLIKPLFKT